MLSASPETSQAPTGDEHLSSGSSGEAALHPVVRSDPRWAGQVKRYSTWPVLQPQTNAEHTWQVLRILTTIWPDAPAAAIVRGLHHDSGELGSGDIPYPYKARHPALKGIMDTLEESSLTEQGLVLPEVTEQWAWRIKTSDLIEMMEKGMDEVMLGNRFGVPIIRAMEREVSRRVHRHPDRPVVTQYLSVRWLRYREAERMS